MSIITFTLVPTAEGFYAAGVLGAGADKVVAVQTNDGDTTYLSLPSGLKEETYVMTQLPSGVVSIDPLTNPTMTVVERSNGAFTGIYKHRWRYNGTNVDVDYSGTITTSYVARTDSRATAPDTSAWTPTAVNGMQCGAFCNGVTAGEPRVTQLFATVNGVYSDGDFAAFCAALLGGIGAALALRDIAGISAALYARIRARILPEHAADVLRELRAHSHRRHMEVRSYAV